MGFFIGCIIVGIIGFGIYFLIDDNDKSKADERNEKFLVNIIEQCNENGIEYQEPKSLRLSIGENMGYRYTYLNGVHFENKDGFISPALYWIDDEKNELYFVGENKHFKVKLHDIEMYSLNGDIKYNSIVKNNGKNVSLSGAVIGGALGGATGMLIGATKDRNNISTDIEEKDERKIYVYYRDGKEISLFKVTPYYDYFKFDEFIRNRLPTKSEEYLALHPPKDNQKRDEKDNTTEEKLKKVKKLFEDGLIDEEEYKLEKKNILEKINK